MASATVRIRWVASALLAAALVLSGGLGLRWGDDGAGRTGTLVAYEPMPDLCLTPAAEQRAEMRQEYSRAQAAARANGGTVTPVRMIKDPYPSFAGVSVDPVRDEVVFTDESLFQVLVYDRRENTPPDAEFSKPRRVIVGDNTNIEFQSSVWVDQKTGEIYAVNNDTRDTTVVFGPGADGNATPVRNIHTPHGSFGIAAAEPHGEVLLTIQHDSAVVTYRKTAGGDDEPIRMIQGLETKLADPHGIAYDPKGDVIFVANFGATHDVSADERRQRGGRRGRERANWPLGRDLAVPGSGTISGPSITVHRRLATGNEAPVRVIEGPATQLNWPTGIAFDPTRRELYVANDMGPSVLVFAADAQGNAAPTRVLKGPKTGLANPTAVALDLKNQELWVANFGGHSATVYDLTASGDVAPKRTIRNAPADAPSLMIGNPGAVGYDTKRQNILVPN